MKQYIVKRERIEVERMISKREYEQLLKLSDPDYRTITKKRLCFFYQNQFIEIDVFDGPEAHAGLVVMEIEQSAAQPDTVIPPFVKVIRNVTGEDKYSNHSMAKA